MSRRVLVITSYMCYRPMSTFIAKHNPTCVLAECNSPGIGGKKVEQAMSQLSAHSKMYTEVENTQKCQIWAHKETEMTTVSNFPDAVIALQDIPACVLSSTAQTSPKVHQHQSATAQVPLKEQESWHFLLSKLCIFNHMIESKLETDCCTCNNWMIEGFGRKSKNWKGEFVCHKKRHQYKPERASFPSSYVLIAQLPVPVLWLRKAFKWSRSQQDLIKSPLTCDKCANMVENPWSRGFIYTRVDLNKPVAERCILTGGCLQRNYFFVEKGKRAMRGEPLQSV